MMFAVGCIQARRCNDNSCPTVVAAQNPRRASALDIEAKHVRVANYHDATIRSFLELTGAMGMDDADKLTAEHIYRRVNDGPAQTFAELYGYIAPNALRDGHLQSGIHASSWAAASADKF